MNRGQMLYPVGNGAHRPRTDVQVAGVFTHFYAHEPVELLKALHIPGRRRQGHGRAPRPMNGPGRLRAHPVRQPRIAKHNRLFADRVLHLLRRAHRNGSKLSLAQICAVLGVPPARTRTALRIINWLCFQNLANREGKTRDTMYWAQ